MKKLFFVLLMFLSLTPMQNFAKAENEISYYAKINNTSTYLCSMPSETSSMFEIPYSYFVKVEYVVDDYFKVVYDGIEGYVKKDKVTLMNGTPEKPFAEASFKIFVPYSLYSSPNTNAKSVLNLDTTTTFKFFGKISGEQINSSTNIWYFCSVISNSQEHYGYIFSGITDYLTKIPTNNEKFEIVDETTLSTNETSEFTALSTGTKVLLIVSISVPSLMILYFLIKPSRILQNNKRKSQKVKTNKIRHGDYFEFDENEL